VSVLYHTLRHPSPSAGPPACITSRFDGGTRRPGGFRVVPCDVPRGCFAACFPEVHPLLPLRHHASGSRRPACESVVAMLAPGSAASRAADPWPA